MAGEKIMEREELILFLENELESLYHEEETYSVENCLDSLREVIQGG